MKASEFKFLREDKILTNVELAIIERQLELISQAVDQTEDDYILDMFDHEIDQWLQILRGSVLRAQMHEMGIRVINGGKND